MKEIEELWALLQKFEECWNQQQEKRPFHLNLLDYCRTYENAHTQILLKILHYKDNAGYPLIDSLLRKFDVQWCNTNPKIEFNKDFIDGYLSDGTCAIIIENKINNAVDQVHQIENYVNKVKERGFELEKIYVFYLTRDGSKQVSQISCPDSLRDALGKRFVEINYRDHILPWLKGDALPRCKVKDEIFISALKQYVDYLEGMLMLRNGEKEMDKVIVEYLKSVMLFEDGSWNHYKMVCKKKERLLKLNDYLDIIIHEVKNKIVLATEAYWKNVFGDNGFVGDGIRMGEKYLLFGDRRWNPPRGNSFDFSRSLIHLEWENVTEEDLYTRDEMSLALHYEGDSVQQYVVYIENNKDEYFSVMKNAGMTFSQNQAYNDRLNCNKIIKFEKPLSQMSEDERRKALFKEYDMVKPLLDYVYSKCEELDGLSTK